MARTNAPKRDYFKDFYADSAVFGSKPATECGLAFYGADRVLFAGQRAIGVAYLQGGEAREAREGGETGEGRERAHVSKAGRREVRRARRAASVRASR